MRICVFLSLDSHTSTSTVLRVTQEWPMFKQHELYLDYQREKEDRKRSSAQYSASNATPAPVDVSFNEILSFPILCSSFKKFVETEFCVEPLMFWCVVDTIHIPTWVVQEKILIIKNGSWVTVAFLSRLEVEEYKRLPRSQYMQNRCRKVTNSYMSVIILQQALNKFP
jgi:hypothetical protein